MEKITLKQIIKNGGATLDENGLYINYPRGYQVSIKDCYIIPVYKLRLKLIKTLYNQNACIGIWIDNNKAYIDLSEHINTKREALKVGKKRNQISIWNWKTSECIYC